MGYLWLIPLCGLYKNIPKVIVNLCGCGLNYWAPYSLEKIRCLFFKAASRADNITLILWLYFGLCYGRHWAIRCSFPLFPLPRPSPAHRSNKNVHYDNNAPTTLHNVMTKSASKVFWRKLRACVCMCQWNDSQVDTHVNVTEDAKSFSVIGQVWLEGRNKLVGGKKNLCSTGGETVFQVCFIPFKGKWSRVIFLCRLTTRLKHYFFL